MLNHKSSRDLTCNDIALKFVRLIKLYHCLTVPMQNMAFPDSVLNKISLIENTDVFCITTTTQVDALK